MKVIIVDDEPHACDALSGLLHAYCPSVQLVAVCNSTEEGIAAIHNYKPELVFLDVELKTMTGFDFLELIGYPQISFEVIFCTAHNHYAVQAFRFSAVDFLLKPILPKQLTQAVLKAQERIENKQKLANYEILKENLLPNANLRMILTTLEGMYIVPINEIVRLCSVKDKQMTEFKLVDGRSILVGRNLGEFDDLKPFIRVHKTDTVNPYHIVRYQKSGLLVLSDGYKIELPISRREDIVMWLNNFKSTSIFN